MKKRYQVVGDALVHGHKKGEKFLAELAEHEESLLAAGGHVVVVADAKPDEAEKPSAVKK